MTAASLPLVEAGHRETPTSVRNGMVDAGFAVVLGILGIVGFRTIYGGVAYLMVGAAGLILGVAAAELARRWNQPLLAEAAVTLVVFLLLGGVMAARGSTLGGLIPTPRSIAALSHVGIYGWKELLTTVPPVGNGSDLLALPYVIGLIGGVTAHSVARRTQSVTLPLVGPIGVLALGILFGARQPASLLLQGSAFVAIALAWTIARTNRLRTIVVRRGTIRNRVPLTGAMLAVAAAVAFVIGPNLPGANSHARVVLSRYVVPPFEANDQSSPLAGFRQYARGGMLNGAVLFTVRGLPRGAPVRIATMDAYNGVVWGFGGQASNEGAASTDVFQHYGSTIPTTQSGERVRITVQAGAIGGVWMPDVGQTTLIAFSGPRTAQLASNVRYDALTGTAAEPLGLQPGDVYSLDAVVPSLPAQSELRSAAAGTESLSITGVPNVIQSDASQWAGNASSAWARVMNIAEKLRTTGYYSNGTETPTLSLPGHGEGRLADFLQGGGLVGSEIVGDDEQYAAALALMADAIGVPARVVLGADPPSNGVVTGRDVHAWVEVSLAGFGWIPIYQSAFLPSRPAQETPPTQKPQAISSAPVEPPVISAEQSSLQQLLGGSAEASTSHFGNQGHGGSGVPAWVVTVGAAVLSIVILFSMLLGLVTALKGRRRRRRRRGPRPSSQIAGAWAELIDVATDTGLKISRSRTRLEQADSMEIAGVKDLANRADAAVFGPTELETDEVDDYWSSMERVARSLHARLNLWGRLKVIMSLRSFRPISQDMSV